MPAKILDARAVVNLSKVVSKTKTDGCIVLTWTVSIEEAPSYELILPSDEHKDLISFVTANFKEERRRRKSGGTK